MNLRHLMKSLMKNLMKIRKNKNLWIQIPKKTRCYKMMKNGCLMKNLHMNRMNSFLLMEENSFPNFCMNLICSDQPEHSTRKMIRFFFVQHSLKNCFLHYCMYSDKNPALQYQNYCIPCCYWLVCRSC